MNIALIIYLVLLVAIAVRSARRVKDIPDFFVARKGASAKAVAGSLVATILGGSAVIGAVDSGAKLGGAASWFMLVGALGLFALIPIAGRAYEHGKYSLPDLVENLYGKGPRMVATIVIPVAWTGIVAAQIIAAAKLLMTFTSMPYTTAAIVSAVVFTGYTLAGGQLSILRTDFLQACLIIVGLLLLAGFAKFGGGELGSMLASATTSVAPKFPFNANFTPLDLFLLILTYGTTYTAGPDIYSRMFCAKDAATAKKAIGMAACVLIPVAFVIGFLAVYGVNFAHVQGARITAIADAVLPSALLPVFALALLSVVLSSADTTLLSSSIIINGLCRKPSLFQARIIILLNGIVALLLVLVFTDIIGTLLLALAVYAGAFTVPILWGLLGFKAKPKFVGAAIIAGGILSLSGKLCPALPGSLGQHTGDILMIAAFVVNGVILVLGRRPRVN
jgi:SSS family solute:Na+ symporter